MKYDKNDSDKDLVLSMQKSNHEAFEKLFKRYAQKLFVFSLSYLKDANQAEEIVQEVFFKVWANRSSLKSNTFFQSYLFTIAFNAIKKSFNKKAKENQYKMDLIDQLANEQENVDFESNYQLVTEKLQQFIGEMPERRRLIFIKRKQQGIQVKQIAEELDISVKTVENQITEAMKYLRKRFDDELPGGLLFFTLFFEK